MIETRIVCPRCAQDWLMHVTFRDSQRAAVWCPECDATWSSPQAVGEAFEDRPAGDMDIGDYVRSTPQTECPICRKDFVRAVVFKRTGEVGLCTACESLWTGAISAETATTLERYCTEHGIAPVDESALSSFEAFLVHCPICRRGPLMDALVEQSPVAICLRCDSLWLDHEAAIEGKRPTKRRSWLIDHGHDPDTCMPLRFLRR